MMFLMRDILFIPLQLFDLPEYQTMPLSSTDIYHKSSPNPPKGPYYRGLKDYLIILIVKYTSNPIPVLKTPRLL